MFYLSTCSFTCEEKKHHVFSKYCFIVSESFIFFTSCRIVCVELSCFFCCLFTSLWVLLGAAKLCFPTALWTRTEICLRKRFPCKYNGRNRCLCIVGLSVVKTIISLSANINRWIMKRLTKIWTLWQLLAKPSLRSQRTKG